MHPQLTLSGNLAQWRTRWDYACELAAHVGASHGAFICVAGPGPDGTAGHDGPFAGIPFAVKDNIDTAEFATTAGTAALRGSRPTTDAPVVARLRAAGARVLGKTNMHELAFGVTSNNAAFGAVRNPYDPTRSAGGSSGGSAVAVALRIVPFALATDTGGSVRIPAAHCGIVGLRPSTGRYSAAGVVRLSATRDTVGVHASSVEDAACIDAVLSGEPPAPRASLAGLRLGVPRAGFFDGLEREVAAVLADSLERLRRAGAVLVDVDLRIAQHLDGRCGFPIVFYETRRDLADYLAGLARPYRSLTLSQVAAQVASPDVADVLAGIINNPVTEAAYLQAMGERAEIRRHYAAVFGQHDIAALVYPTVPILPPPIGDDETTVVDGKTVPVFTTTIRNTSPGTLAGTPAITLPCGRSQAGLPVGLSLEGLPDGDRRILAIAEAVAAELPPD